MEGRCVEKRVQKREFLASPFTPRTELTAQKRLKRSLKRQMLGNTHLWLKSKTKNLIISLYKSAVHHIWSATLSFGLPASTEMLHKLGKAHRDDQELRSCYCAQEGPTKKTWQGGNSYSPLLTLEELKSNQILKSVTVYRWNCETWSYIMIWEPK